MAYNIMIVDDSKIIRGVVRKAIALSEVDVGEVHEAKNGLEALELLRTHWIDLVFADIHMPEMNGVELVQAMSRDHLLESIPVVIVSSERRQDVIDLLQDLGVRAYLKKPFRPEQFRDIVCEVLEIDSPEA